MSILQTLARMIGVREDQTEDALRCEPRAREAVELSRRGFFAAGAVMAAAPLASEHAFSFLFEKTFEEELEGILGQEDLERILGYKLPEYYFDKLGYWSPAGDAYAGINYPFIATGVCIVAIGPGESFEVAK